jgi:hypothetical protein
MIRLVTEAKDAIKFVAAIAVETPPSVVSAAARSTANPTPRAIHRLLLPRLTGGSVRYGFVPQDRRSSQRCPWKGITF